MRQSPIIVRLGTDSVNPFRQQIYKSFVIVALRPQTAKPPASLMSVWGRTLSGVSNLRCFDAKSDQGSIHPRAFAFEGSAGSGGWAFAGCLAARKKRQRQNRLPDLIFYDHHQSRIVVVRIVVALFSQLSDCVLGMRKCRRYIRQVCASRVILDPCPSAYRKEISRHVVVSGTPGRRTTACAPFVMIARPTTS